MILIRFPIETVIKAEIMFIITECMQIQDKNHFSVSQTHSTKMEHDKITVTYLCHRYNDVQELF